MAAYVNTFFEARVERLFDLAELVEKIKATPRRPGVDEIRIPSERSFRERERRRVEGLVFDRKVVESLEAL